MIYPTRNELLSIFEVSLDLLSIWLLTLFVLDIFLFGWVSHSFSLSMFFLVLCWNRKECKCYCKRMLFRRMSSLLPWHSWFSCWLLILMGLLLLKKVSKRENVAEASAKHEKERRGKGFRREVNQTKWQEEKWRGNEVNTERRVKAKEMNEISINRERTTFPQMMINERYRLRKRVTWLSFTCLWGEDLQFLLP